LIISLTLRKAIFMTTPAMRKQLMAYLQNADDKKIKGLYSLLEDTIEEKKSSGLTKEQLKFLNEERKRYLNGEGISYSLEESRELIRKRKAS